MRINTRVNRICEKPEDTETLAEELDIFGYFLQGLIPFHEEDPPRP